MSFSSMHNDYLDPDRHLPPEDYGFEAVLSELKKRNTGRWEWDGIDCSWTGKDADLDPHGHQGCKLISVDEEHATVEVHAGKTFVGTDAALNVPKRVERSNALFEKVQSIWMEQSEIVVCDCGIGGDWDGDAWWMKTNHVIKVPVELDDDGCVDTEETVEKIIKAAKESLLNWEKEIQSADDAMNILSGWMAYNSNGELVQCKDGRPGDGSVWSMYRNASKGGAL